MKDGASDLQVVLPDAHSLAATARACRTVCTCRERGARRYCCTLFPCTAADRSICARRWTPGWRPGKTSAGHASRASGAAATCPHAESKREYDRAEGMIECRANQVAGLWLGSQHTEAETAFEAEPPACSFCEALIERHCYVQEWIGCCCRRLCEARQRSTHCSYERS